MAKNKAFVCFCVDGITEIDTLKIPIEEMFDDIGGDDIRVDFRYADCGDITSKKDIEPDNVEKMIYKNYFKKLDRHSDLGWNDLTYIIHIIDLDGAYVKDENVLPFNEEEKIISCNTVVRGKSKNTLYMDDHIAVNCEKGTGNRPIQDICERNKRKRQTIEHLLSIDHLTVGRKEVKYELYYFSSNMDHFLYGVANMSGAQKSRMATIFGEKYMEKDSFKSFFTTNEYSTKDDYNMSWKKLRNGNASLSRGSNVNLLIKKIEESSLDDWF